VAQSFKLAEYRAKADLEIEVVWSKHSAGSGSLWSLRPQ